MGREGKVQFLVWLDADVKEELDECSKLSGMSRTKIARRGILSQCRRIRRIMKELD